MYFLLMLLFFWPLWRRIHAVVVAAGASSLEYTCSQMLLVVLTRDAPLAAELQLSHSRVRKLVHDGAVPPA